MFEPASKTFTFGAIWKNFSYVVAAIMSLGAEAYSILGIFMIIDTLTGIIRSGVVHGWRSVTSHTLTLGVLAKGLMIIVPLLVSIAGHGVGFNLTFIAKGVLNILILSELYSILSNIQSVRMGKDIEEFDAVNYVLLKLRDIIEKTIKRPYQK